MSSIITGSGQAGRREAVRRHGRAWVTLCLIFAIHILDEILTRRAPLFNMGVEPANEHLLFLQLPSLSFEVWLTIVVEAVIVVSIVSPFVFYGMRWTAIISYPFAIMMFLNGLMHITGSAYLYHAVPGFLSSPLLMFSAIYLLVSVHYVQRSV